MLTLSAALSAYGWVFGVIAFLYSGLNLFIGLSCFKSLLMSYKSATIYSTLVEYVVGRTASNILNLMFLGYVIGALIGYILVCNNLIYDIVVVAIEDAANITSESARHWMKLVSILIIVSLSTPITFKTKLPAFFTKMTVFTMCVIVYLIIVMFIQMFYYVKEYEVISKEKYTAFRFNVYDYFRFYGNFVYSFNCIINVFVMKNRLNKQSSSRHIQKIFNFTLGILIFFYIFIFTIGYISFGNDARLFDLIIQRTPLKGSKDIAMKIGQVLLAFVGISVNKSIRWFQCSRYPI